MTPPPKLTFLDIIQDTVDFYGADPEGRRSMSSTSTRCRFLGKNSTRCAVARYVVSEKNETLALADREGMQAAGLCIGHGPELFVPEVRHLSVPAFWTDLQELHDVAAFWCKTGLSVGGYWYAVGLCWRWANPQQLGPDLEVRVAHVWAWTDMGFIYPERRALAPQRLDIKALPPRQDVLAQLRSMEPGD